MWVMHLLIKQRSPGIALTWWWTHPGHFPCKKSTFVYGKHLQVQISTIFFQAAYQYFSSGTFYVQGLAPGLPTAVLCIDIANGVRWYGRGSSIRRENQIMLIFQNEIAPDYCSAQKDNVPSHVLPLNLPQLFYASISRMGCILRVVGAILVVRNKWYRNK